MQVGLFRNEPRLLRDQLLSGMILFNFESTVSFSEWREVGNELVSALRAWQIKLRQLVSIRSLNIELLKGGVKKCRLYTHKYAAIKYVNVLFALYAQISSQRRRSLLLKFPSQTISQSDCYSCWFFPLLFTRVLVLSRQD